MALAVLPPGPPVAAAPGAVDQGAFAISLNGRTIGREEFLFTESGDSLIVDANSTVTHRTPDGEREIKKVVGMVIGRQDMALRAYTSNEEIAGRVRIRNVIVGSNNTITLVNEFEGRGFSDVYERPPGRFFVVEPQLYSLMSVIARSLRDQGFDRRPVSIVSLALRDTITEAEIVRMPAQTIRWGNRPVQAEHFQFLQGPVAIDLYMDRQGRVLRIEHPGSGLRVERSAPKVKAKSPPPKPGG